MGWIIGPGLLPIKNESEVYGTPTELKAWCRFADIQKDKIADKEEEIRKLRLLVRHAEQQIVRLSPKEPE